MRKGDMPPPVPERVATPRIREDRAVQDFRQNSEKMHRATSEVANTKARADAFFPQLSSPDCRDEPLVGVCVFHPFLSPFKSQLTRLLAFLQSQLT